MLAMASEACLEPSQTSMMELLHKDTRKLPLQKYSIIHDWYDWVLNTPQNM